MNLKGLPWKRRKPTSALATGSGRSGRRKFPLGLEALEDRLTPASPVLVDDINLIPVSSNPYFLTDNQGALFFAVGGSLWKSDGTSANTVEIKTIGSNPFGQMLALNGTVYFTADDGVNGEELWKSDGTPAGTVLVKDVNPGFFGSSISRLTSVNGTVYFTADDGVNGPELWKSDGTTDGTVLVKDIRPGAMGSSATQLTNVNGTLFFAADNGVNGLELWKSDGTADGTFLVKDIFAGTAKSSPAQFTNGNGTLFFVADNGVNAPELWKSDGTADGTFLVKDIRPGSLRSTPSQLTFMNGVLYLSANDGVNGQELWKSDGTTDGTVLVKNIASGSTGASPSQLTAVNGVLYFSATEGTTGQELWKSDGTAAGTVLVKDINPGSSGSFPFDLANIGGKLFFTADNGVNGTELWKSDGTATGTVLVKDIISGINGAFPSNLTNVNGTLFFAANDGVNGQELWKSDGSSAGTALTKDLRAGTTGSTPTNMKLVNGVLYFTADNGINGQELWKSDGTAAGTFLVEDIVPDTGSFPADLFNLNGTVLFTVDDLEHGVEMWRSNGTAAGTFLVKDIFLGSNTSSIAYMTLLNGKAYFAADDGILGTELWRTDGTAAGTSVVKDIFLGQSGSFPRELTSFNGNLYFMADDGENGPELWKSNGTAAGTVLLKDILPGITGSSPFEFTVVNNTLYFVASDGVNGAELWKTDGTPGGTVFVKDIFAGASGSTPTHLTNVNGVLYFIADDGVNGPELWKSDGTAAGTVLVKDIFPGGTGSTATNLTAVNGVLYFTANDGVHGQELWKSDGTATGTVLVKDILPGANSSFIPEMINANGRLFFTASDGVNGLELWKSNGTEIGTIIAVDANPGAASGDVHLLTLMGEKLFFSAVDGDYGDELRSLGLKHFAPVAVGDSYQVNEDEVLKVSVSAGLFANDSESEGVGLVPVLLTQPTRGTLLMNSNGSFQYTPGPNFNGSDSFTYKASNGWLESNVVTVSIVIHAVNDAPVAQNASFTTNEDASFSGQVVATDVENSPISYSKVSSPLHGILVFRADGTFTYTPDADYNGTDSFTYKASDGVLDSNVATVTITVNPVNDAPIATGESYSTDEDTLLTISSPGVLANDTDIDGDPLSAILVTGPANGSLTLNANGSFTYNPDLNFNGTDSFTYKASDGIAESNVATVTITVNAINDAPVAKSVAFATLKNNSVAGQVTASDVDSPALTFSKVDDPSHGTVTFQPDGGFTYVPRFNFFGSDSFTFKASDGALDSNVATVTILVKATNEAPVAPSVNFQVDEDGNLQEQVVGTDVDEDPLSYALVNGPVHGSLVFHTDGTFTYSPDLNYNGSDSFTYKVSDGIAESSVATVTITVNPVNDGPGVEVPSAPSFVVNQDLAISGISVSDIDLGSGQIQVTLSVGSGVLTLKNLAGLAFTAGDGLSDATMTFAGLVGDVNAALASLVYRSNRDSATTDTLTVTGNDLGNTGSGGPLSTSKTLNLAPTQNFIGMVADPAMPGKFALLVQAGVSADTVTIKPIGTSLKNYTVNIAGLPVQTVVNVTGRILVYGLEGNDSLLLGTVKIASLLDGGADNDLLVAGTASDVLLGGLGNDDLRGGLGNDRLSGGLGNDRLEGWLGTDRLVEAGDVNLTLKQGTLTTNGSLVGLGTDVLVLNRIEQADLTGGDGDNVIDASGFTGRVWIFGGKGNDTLRGGRATNTLLGGEGDDTLFGNISRDLLIGGLGLDNLAGSGNEDILIGGTTNHDANRPALDAIMLEWTQLIAYNTRVAHLLGTLPGGKNGAFRLNATTVKADGLANTMAGQVATDWFFAASLVDVLLDRAPVERVTPIL